MSNKKYYDVILFDLDGTLTDPKIGITKAVAYALHQFGIKVEDLDELCSFIGPPLKESFRELFEFSEEETMQAIGYYREYFMEYGMFENKVYHGIPCLLEELKSRGKKLIVATLKPTPLAVDILNHFELISYFDLVVGSELEVRNTKGKVIHYALEQMKVRDLDRVVMVGDRKHDCIGALEEGIDCIGVLYGYGGEKELQQAGATNLVETVEELFDHLV